MPNYNIITKQWTYTVEEQSKDGLDEDGRDLIYMDDEENNFGEEYEYGSEESEEEEDGEESSTGSGSGSGSGRKKSQRRRKNSMDDDFDSDFYKEMEEIQKQIHSTQATRQSNLKKEILTLLKKF